MQNLRNKTQSFLKLITILLFAFIASPVTAQAQDDVIRVNTNLVTIPLSVLDRDGRYVTNLQKSDFQIFEDGVEQETAVFEPTEKPFTILFLIDASSSMSLHKGNLSFALNALATRLRPNDQIMATSFFQWTDVLLEPTFVSELHNGVKFKIRSDADCPDTYLYNAVDDALKRMKKISGRKAIVLLTDGNGGGYGITAEDNYYEAEEQDAIIYTFKFGVPPAEPPSYVNKKQSFKLIEERKGYLRKLAQKTGGRSYQIEEITDAEKTFGALAEELRRQYTLGYYPKQTVAGQKRQIKIKMRQPNLIVRARNSYVAGLAKNK